MHFCCTHADLCRRGIIGMKKESIHLVNSVLGEQYSRNEDMRRVHIVLLCVQEVQALL